jgi:hypothetical protein
MIMVQPISSPHTINSIKEALTDKKASPLQQAEAGGFKSLLTQIGQEAVEASKKADFAMTPQGVQQLNSVERAQIFSDAKLALQQFKSAFEATKDSVEKVLNMQI